MCKPRLGDRMPPFCSQEIVRIDDDDDCNIITIGDDNDGIEILGDSGKSGIIPFCIPLRTFNL